MFISGSTGPQFKNEDVIKILQKRAFCGHNINKLLKAVKKNPGALELNGAYLIFTPTKGKPITVNLKKAQKDKDWKFSRLFHYTLLTSKEKAKYDKCAADAINHKLKHPATKPTHIAPEIPSVSNSLSEPLSEESSSSSNSSSSSSSKSSSSKSASAEATSSSEPKLDILKLNALYKKYETTGEAPFTIGPLRIWVSPVYSALIIQETHEYNDTTQLKKVGLGFDSEGNFNGSIYIKNEKVPLIPARFLSYIDICYKNLPPSISSVASFNKDQLINFCAMLEPAIPGNQSSSPVLDCKTHDIEETDLKIWYTPSTRTIHIQRAKDFLSNFNGPIETNIKNKFSLTLDETGTIVSLSAFDTQLKPSEIPECYLPYLEACHIEMGKQLLEFADPLKTFAKEPIITFCNVLQESKDHWHAPIINCSTKEAPSIPLRIWYNKTNSALNIQPVRDFQIGLKGASETQLENKVCLIIDKEGNITSIWICGKPINPKRIPSQYLPFLEACRVESLKTSFQFFKVEEPLKQFTREQLVTFRSMLTNRGWFGIIDCSTNENPSVPLKIWYNKDLQAINIQPASDFQMGRQGIYEEQSNNKLGLIIDQNGSIISLYGEGKDLNSTTVPGQYLPLLEACYIESLKQSSHYESIILIHSAYINIKLIPKGFEIAPDFHLNQLGKNLKKITRHSNQPRLQVGMLSNDWSKEPGIDAGGPAREYIDSLTAGLMQCPHLKFITPKEAVAAFPLAKHTSYTKAGSLPQLSNEEIKLYSNLGTLMMFCYNSSNEQNFCIGQRFDPALFNAVLSLDSSEINKNELSLSAQRQMMEAMLNAKKIEHPGLNLLNQLTAALTLFDWDETSEQDLSNDILQAAHSIIGSSELTQDKYDLFEDDNFNTNYIEIKKDLRAFIELTKLALLTQNSDIMPPFAPCLPICHQLAKGMMRICRPNNQNRDPQDAHHWNLMFKGSNFINFNKNVQGLASPTDITSRFSPNIIRHAHIPIIPGGQAELRKKIQWLKEWIEGTDPNLSATKEEREDFIKFISGSSSLAQEAMIEFQYKDWDQDPRPIAHTCFNSLELSQAPSQAFSFDDRTKEGFIDIIRASIQEAGGPKFTSA